jgi:elongation factor G
VLQEDPTLRYTRDSSTHQELLEGMGDIHLDTVIEKLAERYHAHVEKVEALVPYKETILSTGNAQGKFKRQTGGKGQFGDCWLRLEPLERGAGFEFGSEVVGGSIPKGYIPAVEKGVHETMVKGFLAGYPVVDIKCVVYDGSYHDVDSSEMAFKLAAGIAFRAASEKAQPVILEPINEVSIDVPDESVGDAMGDLNTRRGQMQGMEQTGSGRTIIKALVPMGEMMRYALDLRSLTHGRGRFQAQFSHYDTVPHELMQKLVQAKQAESGA